MCASARSCWLAQLPSFVPPDEIFHEYAYFSAYSDSWVEHARAYVDMISAPARARRPTASSSSSPRTTATCCSTSCRRASPCSGIDPAANVASAAEERGVPTLVEFFGVELAERSPPRAARPTSCSGTTCSPRCPDHQRLRRRRRDPPRSRRDGDVRVPASGAPARRAPVRHDLPRAFLATSR